MKIKRIDCLYTLDHDIQLSIPIWKNKVIIDKPLTFFRDGKPYMTIRNNGLVTIYKGLQTDGCSPKFRIFGLRIGTWDGRIRSDGYPETYYASLLHDCLYLALDVPGIPYNRKDADDAFLYLMSIREFIFRRVYYAFVRTFGRLAHNSGKLRNGLIEMKTLSDRVLVQLEASTRL